MTHSDGEADWNLKNDRAMAHAVRHARIPLCISDPNLTDNPIVFANDAFLQLTGYSERDVIGKNCRFLQGKGTTAQSIADISAAISDRKVATIEIVNYRKDGSEFINALQIGPILDDEGELLFYFGSQLDITARRDADNRARDLADKELVHRLRNIVNVMTVVIRMTAREEQDSKAMATVVEERLRTLSDAHFQTINHPNGENLSFNEIAETIMFAYAPKGQRQFELHGGAFPLPAHLVSCIALCLHELATNSVKHGAMSVEEGKVFLTWDVEKHEGGSALTFCWRETSGPKVVQPTRKSGSKIIHDLVGAVGGSLDMQWHETGLIADGRFQL